MSIDERLAALTTNVEAISGIGKDVLAGIDELRAAHQDHERWLVLLTKLVAKHDQQLGGDNEQ